MYCSRIFNTNSILSPFVSFTTYQSCVLSCVTGFHPHRQAKLLLSGSLTTFSEQTQFCYFVDLFPDLYIVFDTENYWPISFNLSEKTELNFILFCNNYISLGG